MFTYRNVFNPFTKANYVYGQVSSSKKTLRNCDVLFFNEK